MINIKMSNFHGLCEIVFPEGKKGILTQGNVQSLGFTNISQTRDIWFI